MKYVGSFGGTG